MQVIRMHKYKFIFYLYCFVSLLFSEEKNYNLPYIEEYRLENGLCILISPNYDNPIVHIDVNVKVTKFDEPNNQKGVAKLAWMSNMDGTNKYKDHKSIDEKFISFGSVKKGFENDYLGTYRAKIGHHFLKSDLNEAVELLSEILIYPKFKRIWWENIIGIIEPIALKKFVRQIISDTDIIRAHISQMQANYIDDVNDYSAGHSRKEQLNWYKNYIRPEYTTIMFTGDVNPVYIKELAKTYFKDWKGSVPAPEKKSYTSNITDNSGIKVRFINEPKNKHVEFAILKNALNPNDPLYHEAVLAQNAFGDDGFSSRLSKIHQKFNKYGWLYSNLYAFTSTPNIYLDGKIQYKNFNSLYTEIHNEFINLASNSITQEELDRLKKIEINSYNKNLFKPESFNSFIQTHYNFNGYSLQKISDKWDKIENATLKDVNFVASKIFDPNNYIMVIFGDKDSCTTILNNFENVEYYERTDKLE